MEFNNKVLAIIHPFGIEIWITDTLRSTWFVMAVLILFALFVRFVMMRKFTEVPSGFQTLIETAVDAMDSFTKDNMGEKYSYFGAYFFGLFAMILLSNLSGLFGFRPPTADISTTLAFTIVTVFLIHFMGIFTGKSKYFKEYFEPVPIFFPLNVIDVLAKPISLSFRMFGNILGGTVLMGIVYAMFPLLLKIGVPAVLHVYFDIFAGTLQAFIFTVLSMTFIREKIHEAE